MTSIDPAFLTGLGAVFSIFLAAIGSATASAEAGIYALRSRSGFVKSFIPIVISGVLAIYGIIVSVLLSGKLHHATVGDDGSENSTTITTTDGYRFLCAGLSVGLACAASGYGMASFIKQANATSNKTSTTRGSSSVTEPLIGRDGLNVDSTMAVPPFDLRYGFVMVFLEAIALYGLIVALVLIGK